MLQTHLSIDERARLCYPETLLFMCYVNSQFVSFYTGVGLFPRRMNHHHHGPNCGLWERKLMRRYTQSPGVVAPQRLSVSTLPQVVVEHIHSFGLDLLLDQRHYLSWKAVLPESDFVRLRGFTVLLPTKILAHPLLPATHAYIETHENSIVFLLHDEARMLACHSGEDVGTEEGAPTNIYIVRCQKFPQQPFFITTLCHVCYLPREKEGKRYG